MTSSTTLFLDIKPDSGCDYHRVTLPYGELRDVKPKVPVVVFNREHRMGLPFLHSAKRSGYRIICDLDDCPDLPPDHYLYPHYAGANGITSRILAGIELAHVVTVSTKILADYLVNEHFVPPRKIEVIPNALPFDRGQFVRNSTDTEGQYIYAGGASHFLDTLLLPQLGPDLTFAGFVEGHMEWAKIQSVHRKSLYTRMRGVDGYMGLYEGYRTSLAPLRDSVFNRCKSNLKVLEAGAVGIPLIASKVPPYDNPLDRPYLVYDNWHAKPPARLGEELAAHVREHYHLDNVNELRRQLLESFS